MSDNMTSAFVGEFITRLLWVPQFIWRTKRGGLMGAVMCSSCLFFFKTRSDFAHLLTGLFLHLWVEVKICLRDAQSLANWGNINHGCWSFQFPSKESCFNHPCIMHASSPPAIHPSFYWHDHLSVYYILHSCITAFALVNTCCQV